VGRRFESCSRAIGIAQRQSNRQRKLEPLSTVPRHDRHRRQLGGGALLGAEKREAWERLLRDGKIGALALLRNLRNMKRAGVDEKLVLAALEAMSTARVLPFRFLAAARYAPQWEEPLERAMFSSLAGQQKLPGRTVLLVDVSGSMTYALSERSEMLRTDAAYGLAVLLREVSRKRRSCARSRTTLSRCLRGVGSRCATQSMLASCTTEPTSARRSARSGSGTIASS
jgi:TROVE domain